MFESSGYGSTTLPGFMRQSGSKIDLNSRNASISSGPNIFGSSSPRESAAPRSPPHQAAHLRQQLAARLAVAVLARDRAAVRHDQVGRLLDERAVLREARHARKVE